MEGDEFESRPSEGAGDSFSFYVDGKNMEWPAV
jgi:hypothetical protein